MARESNCIEAKEYLVDPIPGFITRRPDHDILDEEDIFTVWIDIGEAGG